MIRLLCLISLVASMAVASPGDRTLALDPARSTVEVAVHATVDSFTGRLSAYDARIDVAPDTGHIIRASFAFGFPDLRTGKTKRDAAMLEWLGTAHLDGRFVLASLEPISADRWLARGELTLHGVARQVSFPVTITTDQHVYAVDGEAEIDTREFELPVIRMFGVLKVDPLVRVRFHLQGELEP